MNIYELSLNQVSSLLKENQVRPEEVLDSLKKRIEAVEETIKSFITIDWEHAYNRAKELEESNDKKGKLWGCPVCIKDNIITKDIRTTAGSRILENFIPPYDATVIERLKEEGAIILGKTNLDEFAMGSSTENSAFFVTRNPWNVERVPGGSSGGSAAAVASFEAFGALGSDTGGSIRQPASFCGLVGLNPTYGRVSRYGLIAFASSLDQIGPITRNVEDSILLFEVISGHDEKDSTSAHLEKFKFNKNKKLKIPFSFGVLKKNFFDGVDYEIESAYNEVSEEIEKIGGEKIEIEFPLLDYCLPTYYIIATSEASSNLSKYDGVRYAFRHSDYRNLEEMYMKTRNTGFGKEVKRRIILGTFSLSSGYYEDYYLKAVKVREMIRNSFNEIFKKVEVVLFPASPEPAFKIGEKIEDPLKMYLSDIFTVSSNLASIPCISIPVTLTKNNLPIGIQILADRFEEQKLFMISLELEKRFFFDIKKIPC
ncbi:MAG: Asp-tRNA(Asn)/Glu-tRNA(Gln) amidotransferase subunit GatA [Acidobacteriota bacterium]